jgi:hypothetical protein
VGGEAERRETKRRRRRRGGVVANKISNTKLAVAVGSSSKNYNSLLE